MPVVRPDGEDGITYFKCGFQRKTPKKEMQFRHLHQHPLTPHLHQIRCIRVLTPASIRGKTITVITHTQCKAVRVAYATMMTMTHQCITTNQVQIALRYTKPEIHVLCTKHTREPTRPGRKQKTTPNVSGTKTNQPKWQTMMHSPLI